MYSYKYSKLEEMSEFAGFLKSSAWSVSIHIKHITRTQRKTGFLSCTVNSPWQKAVSFDVFMFIDSKSYDILFVTNESLMQSALCIYCPSVKGMLKSFIHRQVFHEKTQWPMVHISTFLVDSKNLYFKHTLFQVLQNGIQTVVQVEITIPLYFLV